MHSADLPPIPDDILQAIADFVQANYRQGRKTDGAYLAQYMRERLEKISVRLGDAVAVAEAKGLVVKVRNVKHLEVVPPPELGQKQEEGDRERMPSVRAEIWRALVFVHQRTRLFVNKTNGRLLTEEENASPSVGDQPEWALIEPISSDTQKKWMHVFVSEHLRFSAEDAPTDDAKWWLAFPAWLREKDPEAEYNWRRFRTQKAVEYLREWARRKDIPSGFVFEPTLAFQVKAGADMPGVKLPPDNADSLRKAILAAVSEMPLEELERLSIPFRYIAHHFKVR